MDSKSSLAEAEPIVIVGMHRSGTTILSRYLDELNIFTGRQSDKGINNEARSFIRLNNWILNQYRGYWDTPEPYLDRKSKEMDKFIIDDMIDYLTGIHSLRFWGQRIINRSRFKDVWGWKDPRTSLTLDLWLKIFPKMKIVYAYRNPIDVAVSLQTREKKLIIRNTEEKIKNTWRRKVLISTPYGVETYMQSPACVHLTRGVALWKMYNSSVLNSIESLNSKQVFYFKYEKFLSQPKKVLTDFNKFINVNPEQIVLNRYVNGLDASRAFAFMSNSGNVALYEKFRNDNIMQQLGYDSIR